MNKSAFLNVSVMGELGKRVRKSTEYGKKSELKALAYLPKSLNSVIKLTVSHWHKFRSPCMRVLLHLQKTLTNLAQSMLISKESLPCVNFVLLGNQKASVSQIHFCRPWHILLVY